MKVIALGDTHGRNAWKSITDIEPADKIVFIGDYFDSKEEISGEDQMENFKQIMQFKRENPEKVVLLFGNHDFHYLKSSDAKYAGHQPWFKNEIGELLEFAINDNLLQMCFVIEQFMFSHAGVTKTWCRNNNINKYEADINNLFLSNPELFGFVKEPNFDKSGDNNYQSPIWVRPLSLSGDKLDNYTHIVGHTMVDEIMIRKDLIFIDTLGTSGEYLLIENGNISVKQIPI